MLQTYAGCSVDNCTIIMLWYALPPLFSMCSSYSVAHCAFVQDTFVLFQSALNHVCICTAVQCSKLDQSAEVYQSVLECCVLYQGVLFRSVPKCDLCTVPDCCVL